MKVYILPHLRKIQSGCVQKRKMRFLKKQHCCREEQGIVPGGGCWISFLVRNSTYYKATSPVKLAQTVSVMSCQHSRFWMKVYNVPLKCDRYLYCRSYLNWPQVR